jgi:hypothetical protein
MNWSQLVHSTIHYWASVNMIMDLRVNEIWKFLGHVNFSRKTLYSGISELYVTVFIQCHYFTVIKGGDIFKYSAL